MLHIVNKLCRRTSGLGWHRLMAKREFHAEAQLARGLVYVRGKEASSFLQGLVTNDMNHLSDGATSMYTMMLNTQGRVLFDSIIYKQNEEAFMVECDSQKVDHLTRHLKMYKVRRKIDIKPLEEYVVWAVFDSNLDTNNIAQVDVESLYLNPRAESKVLIQLKDQSDEFIVTRDPRMMYLGHRILLPLKKNIEDVVSDIDRVEDSYRLLRYRLGVGEGVQELPPTKCLPLEANLDYLHGVSFHKGCYIGQELTARTYHTGVIRKRYMPIKFTSNVSDLPPGTVIKNEKGKSVGKIWGVDGDCGIGLLRVEECLAAESLAAIDDIPVTTIRPSWWPIEASKEKRNK